MKGKGSWIKGTVYVLIVFYNMFVNEGEVLMSFTMIGCFQKYGGWPMKVIDTCQKFYNQFGRYPKYIQMNDKTLESLFEEANEAFLDPYSEEHAVRDSNGELLLPLEKKGEEYETSKNLLPSDKEFLDKYLEEQKAEEEEESQDYGIEGEKFTAYIEENEDDDSWEDYGSEIEDIFDDFEDFDEEDDDTIYPKEFGPNDDCTVSFVTNKFELIFLEGNELGDDYYVVRFGDGPSGGGEDFEEEEILEIKQNLLLAA